MIFGTNINISAENKASHSIKKGVLKENIFNTESNHCTLAFAFVGVAHIEEFVIMSSPFQVYIYEQHSMFGLILRGIFWFPCHDKADGCRINYGSEHGARLFH